MGVYGDFINCFLELMETINFNKDIKIRAIYMPRTGSVGARKKYTSASWALDIKDSDALYVPSLYTKYLKLGDRFTYNGDEKTLVGILPYSKAADFVIYKVERVQGTSDAQDEKLILKEPEFL